MPTIDLIKIPFSFRGAFSVFSIKRIAGERALYFRDVRGGDLDPGLIFKFAFFDRYEEPIPIGDLTVEATPSLLTLTHDSEKVLSITYENQDTVRIRTWASHISTRLIPVEHKYDTIAEIGSKLWEFSSYFKEVKFGIRCLYGDGRITYEWTGIGNKNIQINLGENSEWRFESYMVTPHAFSSISDTFEDCEKRVRRDFKAWSTRFKPKEHRFSGSLQPDMLEILHEKAMASAHILWQNFVQAGGKLDYEALYMTKNLMTNIWSWDNFFSAMGLYKASPKAAYEQLVIFESLQSEAGAFPDYANDRYASYSCNKPPLLGWCYEWLMKRDAFFEAPERLERIVAMAEKQVTYWLQNRMSGIGLPFYTHGNDSGWDNGTFFSEGVPVITPDLTTFLLLQIAFLIKHGKDPIKKQHHQEVFNELLTTLINQLWDGQQFYAIKMPEMKTIHREGTLQRLLPLLLAPYLPAEITQKLKRDLEAFETPYGFSTEHKDSDYYQYDGYWRGPIWAPTTYLFIDALVTCGEAAWSQRISDKFIQLILKSDFAENFDPFTGEGLVDTGFAWTASVFTVLTTSDTP